MKILIDIGHPAHVHYFRNLIRIMSENGHKFKITARDKEIVHALLEKYKIPYSNRGKGGKSFIGKLLYLFKGDFNLYKVAHKFKPDLFLSFASPYAAHVSKVFGKPHIAFDDTEHAKYGQLMYVPFTDVIFSPKSYKKDFGDKHIKFDATTELFYLHPNYFKPQNNIFELLGLKSGEKYIIMRFVSWNASHDKGQNGLTLKNKIEAVKVLSKHCKIFISSEEPLPAELEKYSLKIPFDRIHDVLYYAELFFGESGTMSSEAAILGTTAINISTSATLVGAFDDFIALKLLHVIPDNLRAITKAEEIVRKSDQKQISREKANNLAHSKIDLTSFLVWFLENYPSSIKNFRENQRYCKLFID